MRQIIHKVALWRQRLTIGALIIAVILGLIILAGRGLAGLLT